MKKYFGFVLSFLFTFMSSVAISNPVLNNISAGNVTVSQTPNTTIIRQSTNRAVINWRNFDIAKGQKTQFIQPNSSAWTLNRISGPASQIYGMLSANGRIILVNGAGIHFGPSAIVNVGGLIASTTNISDANFMSGHFIFDQPSLQGQISNEGKIIATNTGLVALIGNNVSNDGLIAAKLGSIVLGSGGTFTFDFNGDQMVNFAIDTPGTSTAAIKNTGKLLADGGQILVSAKAAQSVLDNVIDMQGVAQANSVDLQNGEIILSADTGNISVNGSVSAKGQAPNSTGGTIQVLGENVKLGSQAMLDASGDVGGGKIFVGGSARGLGPLPNSATTTVASGAMLNANAVTRGNGGSIVLWSNEDTEVDGILTAMGGSQNGHGGLIETSGKYLGLGNSIQVNTSAPHGQMGTWLLDPDNITISSSADDSSSSLNYSGNINGTGTYTPASGNSTSVNINNAELANFLNFNNVIISTSNNGSAGSGAGTLTVNSGTTLSWIAPTTLTLQSTSTMTLNGATITAPSGTLVLQAGTVGTSSVNIDATSLTLNVYNLSLTAGNWQVTSSLSSAPMTVAHSFSLTSGVTFVRANGGSGTTGSPYQIQDVLGLQGMTTLSSASYILNNNIDATTTQYWNSGAGFIPIGTSSSPFTGTFNGQNYNISNLYINAPTTNYVGLFGYVNVSNVHSSTLDEIYDLTLTNENITGASYVGGLAGYVTDSANTNNAGINYVTASNGSVTSYAGSQIGGLVGYSTNSISNSGTTNSVTVIPSGTTNGSNIGGLVGETSSGSLSSPSTITSSYAGGNVTASYASNVGGLVGNAILGGTYSNDYAFGNVTGGTNVGGLMGTGNSAVSFTTSYFSGNVFGNSSSTTGYFIGLNNFSTIASGNFYDSSIANGTSGAVACGSSGTSCSNVTPLSTANMMLLSTFTGASWSITSSPSLNATPTTNTWFIFQNPGGTGQTRPMLVSEEFNNNTGAFNPAGASVDLNIVTGHQLQLIGATVGGSYNINANIDLTSGMNNVNDVWATNQSRGTGNGFYPIGGYATSGLPSGSNTSFSGSFTGLLDGHYFTVNDLYEKYSSTANYIALISEAYSGSTIIQNLGLTNASITGGSYAAGFIGLALGQGAQNAVGNVILNNIYVTGSITSLSGNAGGLVGQLGNWAISGGPSGMSTAGIIEFSYNAATITGGGNGAGGIAGSMQEGEILSSYNLGAVSNISSGWVGGLAGSSCAGCTGNATVINGSYSTGAINTSVSKFGGLIGFNNSTSFSGLASYWNTTTSGTLDAQNSSSSAVSNTGGLTTSQMMNSSNFSSWSIATSSSSTPNSSVWWMAPTVSGTGFTYPILVNEEFSSNVPQTIMNAHQLQLVDAYVGGNYSLGANINLSSAMTNTADVWGTNSSTPTGSGFYPLGGASVTGGNGYAVFTGNFNGNGYQIQNIYQNASYNVLGPFGEITTGTVENVGIVGGTISGAGNVGGLVGYINGSGGIYNAYTNVTTSLGNFNSAYNGYLGGMVGEIGAGYFSNDYTLGLVNGSGITSSVTGGEGGFVGGAAGGSSYPIIFSYSNSPVIGGKINVGGFAGVTNTAMWNDYSTGTVTDSFASVSQIGGFVGLQNGSTIFNSYSTSPVFVSGNSAQMIGGFVGQQDNAQIWNAFSTGAVNATGTSTTYVGGFIGREGGTNPGGLFFDYATGNVFARNSGSSITGGFVGGITSGTVSYDYSTGNVFGVTNVGGFVGQNNASITFSYSLGSVTGTSTFGGFAGLASAAIQDSYSTGAVISIGSSITNKGAFIGNASVAQSGPDFWDVYTSGIGTDGSTTGACGAGTCAGITGESTAHTMSITTVSGLFGTSNVKSSSNAVAGSQISVTNATYSGITAPWYVNDGAVRPQLVGEEFYLNAAGLSSTTYGIPNLPAGSTFNAFTAGTPLTIMNGHQLQLAEIAVGANYNLGANINLSNSQYNPADIWNTNLGFSPLGNFNAQYTGTFNGNNYVISNLFMSGTATYLGLFGFTNSPSVIENVGLVNVNLTSLSSGANIGAFAGEANSTFINDYVTGTITNFNYDTGGYVGYMTGGAIYNSYNAANIIAMYSAQNWVGGLIGNLNGGVTISNSYNIGSITNYGNNTSYVGGLVGNFAAYAFTGGTNIITNSYSSGSITASGSNVGGLVGGFYGTGGGSGTATITNSFWDVVTSGITKGYGSVVNSASGSSLYAGCMSGSCASVTVTNATNAGSNITPLNLAAASTYSGKSWTISTGGVGINSQGWFILDGYTRPVLYSEEFPISYAGSQVTVSSLLTTNTIYNAHQLQLMSAMLNGSYSLGNNISVGSAIANAADIWGGVYGPNSQSGFVPVGTASSTTTANSGFSGTFNGNNYVISGLYINSLASAVGLFGATTSTASISNVGLTNETINASYSNGIAFIGGLIGLNNGSVSNVYTTGNVNYTGTGGTSSSLIAIGGLVGNNYNGSITLAYSGDTVSATQASPTYLSMGGLVGSAGNSNTSFAANSTNIANSYTYGNVSTLAASSTNYLGGLVGNLTGALTNTYSTGAVIGGSGTLRGGLIGNYNSGTITSSFWDVSTSGLGTNGSTSNACGAGSCSGATGESTANMETLSTFSGWSITSTSSVSPNSKIWFIANNGLTTRPILVLEEFYNNNPLSIQNAHQLELVNANLSSSYQLNNNINLYSSMTNANDVFGTNELASANTNEGFVPIGTTTTAFSGNFSGNNYVIQNLYEYYSGSDLGLFGNVTSGAYIANVGVMNGNVTMSDAAGTYQNIGGLVGLSSGYIFAAYYSGNINIVNSTTPSNSINAGGFVGQLTGGVIESSYSSGNMNLQGSWNGGFIGLLSGGTITNSYTTMNLYGTEYNGVDAGFVARTNGGAVYNSYASGYVSSSISTGAYGGFLGTNSGGTILGNLWDVSTSGFTKGYNANNIGTTAIYAGCFGTCGTYSISNAVTTGTITPLDMTQASSYTSLSNNPWSSVISTVGSLTAAPAGEWIVFTGATRPMLAVEEFNGSVANPIFTAHQLQLTAAAPGMNYRLIGNIDLTSGMNNYSDVWGTNQTAGVGKGFVPIGSSSGTGSPTYTTPYSGVFNGNNYTVNGLYIKNTSSTLGVYQGLFGGVTGTVENIGATNVNVTAYDFVGGLAGNVLNSAFIINTYSTGSVTGTNNTSSENGVGGLVGNLRDSASIWNSYSAANATGNTFVRLGGLVGQDSSSGVLLNDYSTGTVTATLATSNTYIGGMVGALWNSGIISNAYSSGLVSILNGSTSLAGGLVGGIVNGSGAVITNSLWDVTTSGQTAGYGGTQAPTTGSRLYPGAVCAPGSSTCSSVSVTNANNPSGGTAITTTPTSVAPFNLILASSYTSAGWTNIASTPSNTNLTPNAQWYIFSGETRPMLLSEYNTNVSNAHQLQLIGSTLGASYALQNNIDLTSAMKNSADIWATNTLTSTGNGFAPIGSFGSAADATTSLEFSGSFNGNNYIINNLYESATATQGVGTYSAPLIGLFGAAINATIQNVGLTNITISSSGVTAATGAVVGWLDWQGGGRNSPSLISNVYSTGSITESGSFRVGGLVGFLGNGIISNAFSNVTIATTASTNAVGGLVGELNSTGSTIANSYNIGSVSGNDSVGGLVGWDFLSSGIVNSYSTGLVTGVTANTGGLIGLLASGQSITNSLWDVVTSGQTAGYGGSISPSGSSRIYPGCFTSGTCSNISVTNANNPSGGTAITTTPTSVTPSNLSALSTFTGLGWSATASSSSTPNNYTWFLAASSGGTRPMLMTEEFSGNSPLTLTNAHQFQLIAADLSGSYSLGNNISYTSAMTNLSDVWNSKSTTSSGKGFVTIASASSFNGFLNGNYYVVDGLYANFTLNQNGGTFGTTGSSAMIENLGLTNINYSSTVSNDTGGLVGGNGGTLYNVFITGTFTQTGGGGSFGGLVGFNNNSTIAQSYSSVAISGGGQTGDLVGYATGTIQNSYSFGSVAGVASNAGGLAGYSNAASFINDYSSAAVCQSGTACTAPNKGGLIGGNQGLVVTNSFWDSTTTGQTGSSGSTGAAGYKAMTTAQMETLANFTNSANGFVTGSGWIITSTSSVIPGKSTWFIATNNNSTRPMLTSEEFDSNNNAQSIQTGHQLQLMSADLSGNYNVGSAIALNSGLTNTADVWSTNYNTSTGAGFIPVGSSSTPFTGSLNGNNNIISYLYINQSAADIGLFGYVNSALTSNNINLSNARVTGTYSIGALAGYVSQGNYLGVSSAYTSITGNGSSGFEGTGGLIGSYNVSSFGYVADAYSSGTVTSVGDAGVLIGDMYSGSPGVSYLSYAYSLGSASTSNSSSSVGGLVGFTNNNVANSYSFAKVINAGAAHVGGLIGFLGNSGSLNSSFSAGYISGSGGGIIGAVGTGSVAQNSFWDVTTAGVGTAGSATGGVSSSTGTVTDVIGMSTSNMMTLSNYNSSTANNGSTNPGWSISSGSNSDYSWGIINGSSYPYLTTFFASTPVVVTGTAYQSNGTTPIAGTAVSLATGASTMSTVSSGATTTGANGFYYFLEPTSAISSSYSILASTSNANTIDIYPSGNSLTGLNLTANTVTVGDTTNSQTTLSNTTLVNAYLNSSTNLYSYSGNDITFTAGYSLQTASNANEAYTINGALTVSGTGTLSFNSPTTINISNPITETISSASSQTYNSTVTLASNVVFNDSNSGTNGISFNAISGNTFGITINTNTTSGSSIAGIFSGSGSGNTLTLNSTNGYTGTFSLSNTANSYAGSTIVDGGTLNIASHTALGNASSTIILGNSSANATLVDLLSGSDTISNAFMIGGSGMDTIQYNGTGTFTLTGGATGINGSAIGTGNLTITSTSAITKNISSNIGATTSLASLTLSGGGTDNFTGTTITTAGNQTYNDAFTIGSSSTTFTTTGSGTNHDIILNNSLSWTGSNTLTVQSGNDIILNGSSITATNGSLILSAANSTSTPSMTTGTIVSGSGASPTSITTAINVYNFTLNQGQWFQTNTTPGFTVLNNFQIGIGTQYNNYFNAEFLRVNSSSTPYMVTDIYGLQGLATTDESANYQLQNNIDASTTVHWGPTVGIWTVSGFVSIPLKSGGTFDGNNNVISNLYMTSASPSLNNGISGLFNGNLGLIENIGLVNFNISAEGNNINIGSLVSSNSGTIQNAFATGTLSILNGGLNIEALGGLVGTNAGGTIKNSYSNVTIYQQGVTFAGNSTVYIGGLVGRNISSSVISNSYSIGTTNVSINAGSYTINLNQGGFVGYNNSSTIYNSFWDTQTSGQNTGIGNGSNSGLLTGGTFTTSPNLTLQTTYQSGSPYISTTNPATAWDFTNTWGIISGESYPYLKSFYSGTPAVVSGMAYQSNGSTAVTLGTTVTLATGSSTVNAVTSSGLAIGSVPTFNNGFYYFLEPGTLIPSGNTVLTYITGSNAANGIDIYPISNAISGLNITAGKVTVGDTVNSQTTLSNTTLVNAYLNSSVNLYSYSGNDITLAAGDSLQTASNNNEIFTINGALTVSGVGTLIFNTLTTINISNPATETISSTSSQTYNKTVTLNSAANLFGSGINFASNIIGGGNSLSLTDSSISTLGGAVSGLSTLTTNTINLNSTSGVSTSGAQNYGAVTLGADQTLTSTGAGGITFNSTLDGAHALSIANGSGAITFSGKVGNGTSLNSLTIGTGDTTAINNTVVKTSAGQTYNSPVTLGTNVVFTGISINFVNTILGNSHSLMLSDTGISTFGSAVSGLTTLSTNAINLNSTSGVSSSGSQSYGAITLGADQTLTSTGAGGITFNSSIDGAHALSVANSSGTITFSDKVGNSTALTSLSIGTNNATSINTSVVNTTAGQTYNSAITLGANTVLSGGGINFVSSITGNNNSLTLTDSGTSIFGSSVSGLTTLTTSAINLNSTSGVTSSGAQSYGAITLGADQTLTSTGAGGITFNSTIDGAYALSLANNSGTIIFNNKVGNSTALTSLNVGTTDATSINTSVIDTTASQTYNSSVTLGANAILTGVGINFVSSINGSNHSLTLSDSNTSIFGGIVTGLATLTTNAINLNSTGGVSSSGAQSYGVITLGADQTLSSTGSGGITFNNTIDGAHALSIANNSGTIVLNNNVGNNTSLSSLSIGTSDATAINTSVVKTTGAQTYNSAVTLGANVVFTGTGLNFANSITGSGNSLTLSDNGTSIFGGAVSGLNSLTTNAIHLNSTSGVSSAGAQNYGIVTLGADQTLASTGSNGIVFTSTIDGAYALSFANASGAITFNGNIGSGTALTSLNVGLSNSTAINTAVVKTTSSQIYNSGVTLGANAVFTGNGINFGSTIIGNSHSMTLTDNGISTFGNTVSGLSTLTTNAINLNSINGVSTSGTQSYGAILLGADQTLTSTGAGGIVLNSTLDGAHALSLANNSGTITLSGKIGNLTTLTSLTVGTGDTTAINTTVIKTTAGQTYNSPVTLGANAVLTGTGINFVNSITGNNNNLTLSDNSTSTFGGTVSGLTSLTTNAIKLNSATGVSSSGAQSYGTITLGADQTLISTNAGGISFNSTIDGMYALTVANGSGTVTFNNKVGNNTALTSLFIGTGDPTNMNTTIIKTATGQTYNSTVTLGANAILSGTGLDFVSTLIGAGHSLILNDSGISIFNGTVSGLSALSTNAINLNSTGGVSTTGAQNYGAITLGADQTLISTNASGISFNSTIDGASALSISSGSGTVTFDGNIGNTIALTSLSIGTGDPTVLNTSVVNTTGSQTFSSNITLGTSTALTSSANGTLTLNTITGNGNNLLLNTGGSATLNGALSDGSASSSLTFSGTGTLTLAGANTYTGATTINSGTLQLSNAGLVPFMSALTLASGTQFNMADVSDSIGSLSGNGNINTGVANTTILTIGNDNTSTAYAGQISGAGNLNKAGAGTLTLNNTNFYGGSTNIIFGTIVQGVANAIPATSQINVASTGTITIAQSETLAGLSGAGNLSLNSGVTLTINNSTDSTYSGLITGSGAIIKQGTGTLTFSGTTNFSGGATIQSGTLSITSNASLGDINVSSGGQLQINNTTLTSSSLTLNGNGTAANGALLTTGNTILNSNITLTTDSTMATTAASDILTVNGTINGANALTLSGPGTVNFTAAIGDATPLTSFTSNSAITLNTGTVNTTGGQTYNRAVQLTQTTTLSSTSGTVSLNGTVDGANDLIVNGASSIAGTIGGVTPLNSLTINGSTTTFQSAVIYTTGAQTYNTTVALSGASTTMNASNITFTQGITGSTLNLNGNSGDNTFNLSGNLAVGTINIQGSLNGNNTLQLNNPAATQSWYINGSNTGSATSNNSNVYFNNIGNLIGGAGNNTFTLNGGTVSGSITGGTGVNTLVANNIPNTWNLTGINSGGVTGVAGGFTQIQNITGGTAGNSFNFSSNSSITGTVNGGSFNTSVTNTLNYLNYGGPITINVSGVGSGSAQNITAFTNINNLAATGVNNTITVNGMNKTNVITIIGPSAGLINDPIAFTGFNNFGGIAGTQAIFNIYGIYDPTLGTVTVNGVPMVFSNITSFSFNAGVLNTLAQANAIINNMVVSATLFPMISNNSSVTLTQSDSSSQALAGSSSEAQMLTTSADSTAVTNNVSTIANDQATLDEKNSSESDHVNTNCS